MGLLEMGMGCCGHFVVVNDYVMSVLVQIYLRANKRTVGTDSCRSSREWQCDAHASEQSCLLLLPLSLSLNNFRCTEELQDRTEFRYAQLPVMMTFGITTVSLSKLGN